MKQLQPRSGTGLGLIQKVEGSILWYVCIGSRNATFIVLANGESESEAGICSWARRVSEPQGVDISAMRLTAFHH